MRPTGLTKLLGDGTLLHALLVIMNKVGVQYSDNLPLIFAVGVAIGMAKKEKEVSALSAVIAYFVMNTAISAMLTITRTRFWMMEALQNPSWKEPSHLYAGSSPCRWACLAVLS